MRGYLYVVARQADAKDNYFKLGLTIYPDHRLRQYTTGDRPGDEHEYFGLWLTKSKTKDELKRYETKLHYRFRFNRLPRKNGVMSEWFQVALEEIVAFLDSADFIQLRVPQEQIALIREKVYKPRSKDEGQKEKNQEDEEKELIQDEKEELQQPPTLLEKFMEVFLPGKSFRRNQKELWEIFENMCLSEEVLNYRGIVQWPTGTGKTIAMLLLIVLAADRCKRKGEIYRGIIVSQKNDIFGTIIKHLRKLEDFGIKVCEGQKGQLSSLAIPRNEPILIIATHAALVGENIIAKLPPLSHVHYDEVHRIGGDELFALLEQYLPIWKPEFLTGTSATPKTANPAQHRKITKLFGDPLTLLHKCDVDEAIREGWIAQPRFSITIVPKNPDCVVILRQFLQAILAAILEKQRQGKWQGGKSIVYIPWREGVCHAVELAKEELPSDWKVYTAVEDADAVADDAFVTDPADGTPRILFACERYREGSDIDGLEMTGILMGNTIAANILIQIVGRALRADYPGKEGWCCIFRPSEEGTSEEEVLDKILLEITDILGTNAGLGDPKVIARMVETFLGTTTIRERTFSVEETVARIQALYDRRIFDRGVAKEKYECVVAINREIGLKSRDEYLNSSNIHRKFISDPKKYFDTVWQNWYHFLGVDTSSFPQTKMEWIRVCKYLGLNTWDEYKKEITSTLPRNPGEMYEDFTNWDKEFGIEEEIVW